MLSFQRYIFAETARILLLIVATLSVLALLAQGLTYTEIIQENRQSIGVYIKIIALGAPKVLALLLPLALFVASLWSLNRFQRDAEIIVVQATGMTHWQVASPVLRLAVLVATTHLALNLWAQPAAQRELRESLIEARTDLATSLIRPGQFTTNGALTFYARGRSGQDMVGIFISDARDPNKLVEYIARKGRILEIDGKPAFIMEYAQIHQKDEKGELSILDMERYNYDLAPFAREETDTIYKAADRYLPELIWLDQTNYVDARSRDAFTAEIHYRLTAPLMNIAMVLLAIWAILGGDYEKQGYGRRIVRAGVLALLLLVLHIVANSESKNAPLVNVLQWLLPLVTILWLSLRHFAGLTPRLMLATNLFKRVRPGTL